MDRLIPIEIVGFVYIFVVSKKILMIKREDFTCFLRQIMEKAKDKEKQKEA